MDWRQVYERVLGEVRRDRMTRHVLEHQGMVGTMSFSGYGRAARWLEHVLGENGLQAGCCVFPADGITKIGDRIMPLAWDVRDAELRLVEPDGRESPLVSYRTRPYCIVMFCSGTEGWVEAPLVRFDCDRPRGELEWKDDDFRGLQARGACVLLGMKPDVILIRKLAAMGAAGFICDGVGPRSNHHRREPDAVRWINDAFGEGMIHQRTVTLPGFSIPPTQANRIRDRLTAGQPLRARFRVDAGTYSGELSAVQGVIAGHSRPDERVYLLAHMYEPNVINDCAGVAMNLEAMIALRGLIDRGLLPAPARSIEMFSSMEMFGIAAHATRNPRVRETGIAGLCLDCLPRRDGRFGKEVITLYPSLDSSPSFVNALMPILMGEMQRRIGLPWTEVYGFSSNENMLCDPTLGPATAMLNGSYMFADGTYHTDADTVDRLDPLAMSHTAAVAATMAYVTATAGTDEALWLAGKSLVRARERVTKVVEQCLEAGHDCPETRLKHVQAIEAAAIASTRRLAPDSAPVQARVASLTGMLAQFADRELDRLRLSGWTTPACPGDKALWSEASRLVPSRKIRGPLSCADTADEVAREYEAALGSPIETLEWRGGCPDIFWMDGRRSIAEICELSQLARPKVRNDAALRVMMKFYQFLNRHNYITLKAADGDDQSTNG